ncbi:hypothetical protein C9J03_24565 [Photobacterium gaetbulicola]|nr:hypothetical protein C9J03_24565 [Photobacterium gaetbulicola]
MQAYHLNKWSVNRDSARLGFQTPPLWSAICQELEMRDQTKLFNSCRNEKSLSLSTEALNSGR